MATTIYKQKDITLQDGTEVTIKPLAIGRLRRFQEAWKKFAEAEDENAGLTVFVNCAGIGLEENFTDKFETLKAPAAQKAKGEFLSPEYKTYLEDVLDLDTIYEILNVTGGIVMNDPKAMENLASLAEADEDGTN
jgi:hypothetical protein